MLRTHASLASSGRRSAIIAVAFALFACGIPDASRNRETQGTSPERANAPNFVVVFLDDLGWADFSCFGNRDAETEHIDRLAREGIAFEQFYVNSPICSPSRCALLTGQWPQRWRITSYLAARKANARRGIADWLDPSAPSIARALQRRGYATGHFGKWHLGGQRDVGDAPAIGAYGFDESLTNFEGLGPRLLPLCDAYDGKTPRKHALGSDRLGRGPIEWVDRAKISERFVDATIAFIDKAQRAKKPFFVNLWPDDVHSPFFPPKARRGDGSRRARYLGVLETLDEELGRLFDHLRAKPALRDNTLVLLCSDNGHEPGAGRAGPLRGAKTTLFEGGVRSPLIAWAPGLMPKSSIGTRDRASVFSAIDFAPSLLALARASKPARGHNDARFDGHDVAATLVGRAQRTAQRTLFFRRPPDRKQWRRFRNLPDLAIREGKWKLLCDFDGTRPQLYDLSRDPGERTNLASQQPGLVSRLRARIRAWNSLLPSDAGERGRSGSGHR